MFYSLCVDKHLILLIHVEMKFNSDENYLVLFQLRWNCLTLLKSIRYLAFLQLDGIILEFIYYVWV